jgi:hypothetical protein
MNNIKNKQKISQKILQKGPGYPKPCPSTNINYMVSIGQAAEDITLNVMQNTKKKGAANV